EALHRSMMQAYAQAAALDRRLQEARRREGIEPLLELWLDAAFRIGRAARRARAELLREGNSAEHLDRIEKRLASLRAQAQQFVLASDLDTGAASWQHLAYEVSSLSGQRRNDLVRFLQSRKDEVDDALEGLARQRPPKAIDPEEQRRIRELQDEHRRASERYERLRERYLAAPRPGAAVPAPALVAFEHHARRFEVPL